MAAAARRSLIGKLQPANTALLLCDVQERFRSLIYEAETVIQTCRYMTSVASILGMPTIVTEQYPKVFGPTVSECFAPEITAMPTAHAKKKFSMMTEPVVAELFPSTSSSTNNTIDSCILVGIETHVCVQQTCLDLLEMGKEVHIIVDGVSSQQPIDRQVALRRMEQAGAFLTTAQSAAFMLMQSADHPQFKSVSKLTVAHMQLPNAFNGAPSSSI